MDILREHLGRRLSIEEVADYFGVDIETVRRHYRSIGGIRLGRRILFFENLIIEAIKETSYALQAKEQGQGGVGSRSDAPREAILQDIPLEGRCARMGIGNKKKATRELTDPFGLLEAH
jgi:AraC-like DNA-binding protein